MGHVIGFSAWSGTGKTTLLEKVIRRMKARGLRVAVVKHDVHGIAPCDDGKDSGRLRMAGADRVVLIGPEARAPEESLWEALDALRAEDIILVEGFKHAPIPRVGLCRMAVGKPLPEPPESYIAVVSDAPIATAVPRFGWNGHKELTDFLMEQRDFSHFNSEGRARMVDVGDKGVTHREAVAAGLSQGDSLVSLRYLEQTVLPGAMEQATARIQGQLDEVAQTVSGALDEIWERSSPAAGGLIGCADTAYAAGGGSDGICGAAGISFSARPGCLLGAPPCPWRRFLRLLKNVGLEERKSLPPM